MAWKLIVLVLLLSGTLDAAVRVTFSTAAPSGFQDQFIEDMTHQYQAIASATPYFPADTSLKVFGYNPLYQAPTISTSVVTLDKLISKILAQSTWTYVQGFANGMDYERLVNLDRIGQYTLNCSTPSYFGTGLSTSNWNAGVCTTALMAASMDIYNLRFSTPTTIPPLPGIFTYLPVGASTGPVSNVVLKSKTTGDCYKLEVQPNGTVFTSYVSCPKP